MNDEPKVQLPEVGPTGASTRSGIAPMPLVPTNIEQCWQMAQYFSLSGAVPSSFPGQPGDKRNIAAVFGAIQVGASVGLSPVTALSTVMMVNNRYAMFGDGQLAVVRKSGLLEYIKESYEGKEPKVGENWDHDYKAVCVVKRIETEPEETFEFSVGDAVRAGLWAGKDPWKKYPKRMLKHRARAFAMRDLFGDVLLGLQHTAEELIDVGGDLVQDSSGAYVPDRPTRGDFKETTAPEDKTVTDAEVVDDGGQEPEPQDAPVYGLFDAFGETIGEYSPGAWVDEFCLAVDRVTSVGALDSLEKNNAVTWTQEIQNNVDRPETVDEVRMARREALLAEAEATANEHPDETPDLLDGTGDG